MRDLKDQAIGANGGPNDPNCPEIEDFGHTALHGLPLESQPWSAARLREADAVVIVADHSNLDYQMIADEAVLVVDTRGAMRNYPGRARVIGLSAADPVPVGRVAVA